MAQSIFFHVVVFRQLGVVHDIQMRQAHWEGLLRPKSRVQASERFQVQPQFMPEGPAPFWKEDRSSSEDCLECSGSIEADLQHCEKCNKGGQGANHAGMTSAFSFAQPPVKLYKQVDLKGSEGDPHICPVTPTSQSLSSLSYRVTPASNPSTSSKNHTEPCKSSEERSFGEPVPS